MTDMAPIFALIIGILSGIIICLYLRGCGEDHRVVMAREGAKYVEE